jgi:hypothetical protein
MLWLLPMVRSRANCGTAVIVGGPAGLLHEDAVVPRVQSPQQTEVSTR